MRKIRKIVQISIVLFLSISILVILILTDKKDFDFLVRNINPAIQFLTSESYEQSNKNIDVLQYDLALDIFHEQEFIKENAKIKFVILNKKMQEIRLDFYDNFKMNFVKLNGNKAKYRFEDNEIVIANNNVVSDTATVEIDFEGKPKNLGMGSFAMEEKNEKFFISTLNEPIFASTWFPCNDTPMDKAHVKVSVTNDSNIVSLSNGKLKEVITKGGRRTYTWESQYPIATYLISIFSGEYKRFSQKYYSSEDTMNIDYYVTKESIANAQKDFAEHPKYLKVFSKLFGEYPFIKDKYGVAEILWEEGAMESQTITGFGSNFISGLNFYESILIHEVAHHWWGNSVSLKGWNDIWLNEGLATYSEALYYEKVSGIKALQSTMLSFKSRIDIDDEQILSNPGTNLFSSTIYNKGAWVFHMLRKEIGDSLFFEGIKKYYETFKYKNVNTKDLKETFELVSNKSLDKFFEQWVNNGSGLLELDISWSENVISENNISLEINIKQMQAGYKNYHFPLDIDLIDSQKKRNRITPYISCDTTLILNPKHKIVNIVFDKENWLLTTISE
jgi:aminopeptidase N